MHEHGYNFYICMQVISIRMRYSNQKPFLNVHNWNKCIINIKCSNEGWSVISFAAMFQSCHLTLSTQPMAIWEGSGGVGVGGENSALMTRPKNNGEGSFSYSTHKYYSLFSFTSDLPFRLRESQLDSQYMEHWLQEQLNYGIFLTWSS